MKWFIVAMGAAALVAGPQASNAAQSDKAAEVLAAARKAIGDRALQTLNGLEVDAGVKRDVGSMQLDSDLELLVALPDKYARSETITRGPASSTSTTGFNGDALIHRFSAPPAGGGMLVVRMVPGAPLGPDGKPAPVTPEQQQEMNKAAITGATADLSRLMLGWFAMAFPSLDATYTYAGEAVSPDGKADVIDVKGADGFAARLFVDEQSHLPLMVTYTAPKPRIVAITRGGRGPADGKQAPDAGKRSPEALQKEMESAATLPPDTADFALYFDDWRKADGVQFPFTIRRAMSGTTTEEWTVKKVQINPTIDPKKFEVEGS